MTTIIRVEVCQWNVLTRYSAAHTGVGRHISQLTTIDPTLEILQTIIKVGL